MITTHNLVKEPPIQNYYHRKFSSLSKFIERASEPSEVFPDMYRSSRQHSLDNWSGGSFENAVEQATYGWSEGFKVIMEITKLNKNIFDDLLPKQDYLKQVTLDVEGESVDVGLAVQGIPENMITTIEDTTNKVVVTGNKLQRIIYQNSFSSGINKQTVFNYGAVICLLINSLELHGFRTEVICRSVGINTSLASEHSALSVYDTIIKNFEESPDYNKLAFCLASSMYTRRLEFGIQETEDKTYSEIFKVNKSNGYPCNYKADLVEQTDIYIPYIVSNVPFQTIVQNFRQLIEIHFKEVEQKD